MTMPGLVGSIFRQIRAFIGGQPNVNQKKRVKKITISLPLLLKVEKLYRFPQL